MQGYASLWYEHLKTNKAMKAKSKIKIWFELEKQIDKRFLPFSYKYELYLKITWLVKKILG